MLMNGKIYNGYPPPIFAMRKCFQPDLRRPQNVERFAAIFATAQTLLAKNLVDLRSY